MGGEGMVGRETPRLLNANEELLFGDEVQFAMNTSVRAA